jgi:hypothetical protein
MSKKQDDVLLEFLGKLTMYLSPLWIPALIYWYAKKNPDDISTVWNAVYPIVKMTVFSGIGLLLFIVVTVIAWYVLILTKNKKSYRYVRIVPHVDGRNTTAMLNTMIQQIHGYKRPFWERLFKGREWFHWYAYSGKDGIAFYVGFPLDRELGIKKAITNAYPTAELHPVKKDELPLPSGGVIGRMKLTKKGTFSALPLSSYSGRDFVGDALMYLEKGSWLSLTFSPDSGRELRKCIRKVEHRLLKKKKQAELGLDSFEREQLKSMTTRFSGGEKAFQVEISVQSTHEFGSGIVSSIATSISSAMNLENGLYFHRVRKGISFAPYPLFNKMTWTGSELMNLLHFPDMAHNVIDQVPHLERGQRMLDKKELATGISIGTLQHPVVKDRRVCISKQQFTKHFVLTGKTGSGKSSTVIEIIQDMIDEWIENPQKAPGFSFFDPASVTALTVLNRLLKAEKDGKKVDWSKVHYVGFKDTEYPPSLNLLHRRKSEDISTVTANIMDLFKTVYPGATPRMDRILENSIGSLLSDKKQHSILGVVPLLLDDRFQAKVKANLTGIDNKIYKDFWGKEAPKNLDTIVDPVLNRISPFRTSSYMRRMFGRAKWSLDIRKWMDEGHIVLFDLLGMNEKDTTLVVGHIITQYHQTVIRRPEGSKLHMTMIDEAHLVQIPILPTIIAFDRKFGLSLGLITQYVGQFDSTLRYAIQENIGNIFTCSQGTNSASVVEEMVAGRFRKDYLQTLPDRVAAVYTQSEQLVNGKSIYAPTTCTVISDPPFIYLPNGQLADYKDRKAMDEAKRWSLEKAKELQKRDGEHIKVIDEDVARYLGHKDEKVSNAVKIDLETEITLSEDEQRDSIVGNLGQIDNVFEDISCIEEENQRKIKKEMSDIFEDEKAVESKEKKVTSQNEVAEFI